MKIYSRTDATNYVIKALGTIVDEFDVNAIVDECFEFTNCYQFEHFEEFDCTHIFWRIAQKHNKE